MTYAIQSKLKRKIQPKCKAGDQQNQDTKEDKTTAKEITEAFSAVTGQEISEEEVSLIQDIQLPEDETNNPAEDVEASEEENKEM